MYKSMKKLWQKSIKEIGNIRFNWVWAIGMVGATFLVISLVVIAQFSAPMPVLEQAQEGIASATVKSDATFFQQYQIADKSILGFELVRINVSGDAVIAGHAPASARVIVELNGVAIGGVQTDERGEWVFLTPMPLPTGQHRLTLEAISEDETTKIYGDQSLVIIVPQKSVVLQGGDADKSEPLVVLLPSDAESGSRVLRNQFTADKTSLGKNFTVDTVDYSHLGLLILGGRLQAEAIEMIIYMDNRPIARKRITGKGAVPVNWEVQVPGKVVTGRYQLRVDMVQNDRVILRRILPFEWVDLEEKDQDKDFFIVQPGNSLWYIARNILGAGARHTVLYDANRQQIHEPDQIYPGQILMIPRKKDIVQEEQKKTNGISKESKSDLPLNPTVEDRKEDPTK